MNNHILTIIIMINYLIAGCSNNRGNAITHSNKPDIRSIEIFMNDSTVWELAKAVDREKLPKIRKLLTENPKLVDYQDPYYGLTLLMRAVKTEKYRSAQELLKLGANSNIMSDIGVTALSFAIDYSWYDNNANTDPKFVKLLLEYGANPNTICYESTITAVKGKVERWVSPLIQSVSQGYEKAKLLLEYGADIKYKTDLGETAASRALLMEDVDVAYLLIVEKKSDISEPFYFYSLGNDSIEWAKPHYPVDLLLDWVFELNSLEYQKKQEIIKEFSRQGINYRDRKNNISDITLRKIKYMYPNDWEEYVKKY